MVFAVTGQDGSAEPFFALVFRLKVIILAR
jgi:hypothetical protein